MKGTISKVVVLVGAVAMVLGTPSLATAHDEGEHIKVTAREVSGRTVDVGPKGDSVGDVFIFTERLTRAGKRVGRSNVKCEVMRVTKKSFTMHCTAAITLTGKGQLIAQGTIRFKEGGSQDITLAVTGGTGDYAGAAGEFEVVERRGKAPRYVIHLEP